MMPELSNLEIEEYKSLRAEIGAKLKELASLQLYALAGTGAVWAWLGGKENQSPTPLAWFIPVLLVFFAGFRSWVEWRALRVIATYLQGREAAYKQAAVGITQLEYWETWRAPQSSGEERLAWVFWCCLVILTLAGGAYGFCHGCPAPHPCLGK